jgi:hypothetical protein
MIPHDKQRAGKRVDEILAAAAGQFRIGLHLRQPGRCLVCAVGRPYWLVRWHLGRMARK